MSYLIPISIIFTLIVLNGLFVAAEFALIGVSRAAIERRAALGEGIARLLAGILRDPRKQDQYIATAQLGITFASLGLGMYGEHILATWISGWLESFIPASQFTGHAIASVIAISLLTYLHIVLGEMIPKTLALQHAESTSLWITPVMRWVRGALYPLVIGLNRLGNFLLRMLGIHRTAGAAQLHTPEELEQIIDESEKGGALDERSASLMRELLSLREKTAGELMVPRVRVRGFELGTEADELRQILRKSSHTRFPVYENSLDTILGFVHIKDLLPLLLSNGSITRDHVKQLPFVPESMNVDDVFAAMRSQGAQMAVVMDEHGGTAGIVTEKDMLDELVGEVHEDSDQAEIWLDQQSRIHVAGTALLSGVGEQLGIELEHEDVDTVSGLVLAELGRPPRPGDAVQFEGVEFIVESVSGHGVQSCLVKLIPPAEPPDHA